MSFVTHLNAVVLAGGGGQRFWPLSRELNPKQLLTLFGEDSLIVQAINRVLPYVGSDGGVTVVTGERLFEELRNHLTAQPDSRLHRVRYLQEPVPRNTAPAIALAAAVLVAEDPDAIMVVLPSDHILADGPLWADCMASATELARDGYLVTIGIAPTRPETGYGYIAAGASLDSFDTGGARPHVVDRFVEKPDAQCAEEFVASGVYFWNAGIFVMRASRVLEELDAAGGEIARIATTCREMAGTDRSTWPTDDAIRECFAALTSVSIDVAVMERATRRAVIPAALEWSDVGSLLALEDLAQPDAAGTVRVGRGVDLDSSACIVYSTDRLVATLGLRDTVVVDTADATLVCAKDRVQDVRHVVDALKAIGADEVVQPKTSLRPWGSWTDLLAGTGYRIKSIEVSPGARLSLQRHAKRSEHWVVVAGQALVTRGSEQTRIGVNEGVYIPIGETHRLENPGTIPLRVIEVQVGPYVGEDDIERLEDDWDR